MGTTLTGTTPQDTYDSLIKVTDNGPISGTAKYLSDGLGNDSALALSTAAVGVGTTSNSYTSAGRGNLNIAGSAGAILGFQIGGTPKGYVFHDNTNLQLWNEVAGDLLFGANATERMRITSAGNVGIGTSSPNVSGYSRALTISSANSAIELTSATNVVQATIASSAQGLAVEGIGTAGIRFFTSTSGATTERVRITNNGLTFNGDTAAANALDDYEEGTFTPTASSGITIIAINNATYTKIGNTVTFQIWVKVDISSTSFVIAGLPFTASGRTTGSVSNTSLGQPIANLLINNEIYGYSATIVLDDDLLIGGVYRVA